jgi:hypothetical protein
MKRFVCMCALLSSSACASLWTGADTMLSGPRGWLGSAAEILLS